MADFRIFLDWNAGAPLRPEGRAATIAALSVAGNPSSVHQEGRAARRIIDDARSRLAALVGAAPGDIVFTSGATEAANMALSPQTTRPGGSGPLRHLVMAATEHLAVLQGHRFPADAVEIAPVGADGRVEVAALGARVAALTAASGPASVMVAVQAANNETGILQPTGEVARALAPHGAVLVVDAAQSAGKAPYEDVARYADMAILSAHKLGGPKGVGALVHRHKGVRAALLLRGGGQEARSRAGTENVAGIAGFAAAAEAAWRDATAFAERAGGLRAALETELLAGAPGAVIYGRETARLANTTLIGVPGVAAETLVMALDLAGAAVSSGAACSSGKVGPSHVLAAMGVGKADAGAAVRISFGWETTAEDLHRFSGIWAKAIRQIRRNGAIEAA